MTFKALARQSLELTGSQFAWLRFFGGGQDPPKRIDMRPISVLETNRLIAWHEEEAKYVITDLGQEVLARSGIRKA